MRITLSSRLLCVPSAMRHEFIRADPPALLALRVTVLQSAVSGDAHYGLVPQEHWHEPEWIDQTKAAERRKSMEKAKVIYGGSESYRRMCRYQSGFFYRHELLQSYDYYWRIEPGVRYFCDIDYDPFVWMQENNKKYAFTISIKEYEATIPSAPHALCSASSNS